MNRTCKSWGEERLSRLRGFTLVELLISIALAGLVLTGLLQMYTMSLRNNTLSNSVVETQESGRLALSILAKSLRMAGYMGCVNTTDAAKVSSLIDIDISHSTGYDPLQYDFTTLFTLVNDYDASPARNFPSSSTLQPVLGSDIIYNRGAMATSMVVKTTNAITDTSLQISGRKEQTDRIFPGDVLMVSDCSQATIFVVSSITRVADGTDADLITMTVTHDATSNARGVVNTQNTLNRSYVKGSQILLMNAYQYFLAPSSLTSGSSLYRYNVRDDGTGNIAAVATELVPFLDSLQFRYSVDTNSQRTLKATGDGVETIWELPPDELASIVSATVNGVEKIEGADYTLQAGTETPPADNPSSIVFLLPPGNLQDIEVVYQTQSSDLGPDEYRDASGITEVDALNNSIYGVEVIVVAVGQVRVDAPALTATPLPPETAAQANDGRLRKRYTQVIGLRNAGVGND